MFNNYNEEDLEVTEYKFIFEEPNNGWWLEIDSVAKLIDYHKKTEERLYGHVIREYMDSLIENRDRRTLSNRTLAIVLYAEKHHLTFIDAIVQFRLMIAQQQLERIHEEGAIYLNSSGGYHSNAVYTYSEIRDKLIFPDYKEDKIKINQFPGGTHWYAYIGNVQIKNGNVNKWNSYEEAYEYAKKFISG